MREIRAPKFFLKITRSVLLVSVLLACVSEQDQKYHIGFSQCVSNDRWRQAMHTEMEREIFFYKDELKLEILDAEGSNTKQIEQIEYFLRIGVDLLIVSPNESEPITPIIEEAFNSGIPVVVLDRKTTSNLYTSYVGADNYEIGKIAGNYINDIIHPGDTILEIWGLKGSSPAIDRSSGFNSSIVKEDIEVIPIYADWTKKTAKIKLREMQKILPQVKLIFAHNDEMALGAFEVLKVLNLDHHCQFVGVDALAGSGGGIQFVEDDIIDATFLYPTGGEEAIRTAYNILYGLPFNKENILQTTVIDDSNVRIMKLQTDEILSQQSEINRQQNRIEEQIRIYRTQRMALYGLIGFLTLSILLGAYTVYALREKRNANKTLIQKNNQINQQKEELETIARKAEEATKAKFQFFTNISHEFRTPLSLIMGPLDLLLNDKVLKTRKNAFQHLHLIKINAQRLLRLINQLMAFRKIENDKLKLKVEKHDIVEFIKEIKEGFTTLSIQKNIDFQLICEDAQIELWYDKNWLDKVIFNLLSNAFKFTGQNGLIHIHINQDVQKGIVSIKVEDNGRGMSQAHVTNAFDRFYSSDDSMEIGTGLGLSLSKELIELHGGEIILNSKEGIGTVFEVNIPMGKDHFNARNLLESTDEDETVIDHQIEMDEMLGEEIKLEEKKSENAFTLLIIEDNDDLINFLSSSLSAKFNVIKCTDGQSGLNQIIEIIPDLVVCDISLPGKDGLAITRSIKSDYRTSHIPVVLLTARSQDDQKLDGIRSGADAYITKPFQFEFLLENIKTLLRNRESLKMHFSMNAFEMSDDDLVTVKNLNPDDEFIKNFKTLVKENINNPKFNVQDICVEMGFSRVQLYRKVKVLLDCSVNDYINTVRLKRAIKLLRNSESSISDIAYDVGFSSPAYFSTSFKSYFKISPSDARKS